MTGYQTCCYCQKGEDPKKMSSLQKHLRLAEGVVKALFTTSPTKATEVIVKDDGRLVVRPAQDADRPKATASHA
jgi:hypothetical protein